MLSLSPSEVKAYLSCLTPELLNTIKALDLPNHELKLKVGVHVLLLMLLINIDQSSDFM